MKLATLTFGIIILMPVLNACQHKEGSVAIPGLTMNTVAHAAGTPKTILVMGQSNAVRLNPAGYKGWNQIRYGQDTGDTFINCAVNGSWIADWDPSGANYQACLTATTGQHIDVILWYQGESDGVPTGHHADYAYQLTRLFPVWRTQWGSGVPILYAQIAVVDPVRWPNESSFWQEVQDQQASICYPNATMVRTNDITAGSPLANDGIHFTDPGDYEVGSRFARTYQNMGYN